MLMRTAYGNTSSNWNKTLKSIKKTRDKIWKTKNNKETDMNNTYPNYSTYPDKEARIYLLNNSAKHWSFSSKLTNKVKENKNS